MWGPLLQGAQRRRSLRPPPFLGQAQVVADLMPELGHRLRAGAIYEIVKPVPEPLFGLEPGLWFVYVGRDSRIFYWGRLEEQVEQDVSPSLELDDETTQETEPVIAIAPTPI